MRYDVWGWFYGLVLSRMCILLGWGFSEIIGGCVGMFRIRDWWDCFFVFECLLGYGLGKWGLKLNFFY